MRFSMALQADEVSADQSIVIKIYAKVGEELNLVRRYTSLADVPEKLSLLAGDYVAKVEVGEDVVASFDAADKYYYGEQPFTIKAGLVESVAVECKLQNTMVAVEYDYTVDAIFEDGYTTTVAIAEEYVEKDIKSGKTPALVFAESKTGYMLLPEGQTTLVWQFEGINPNEVGSELPDGSVTEDGKLTFKGEIKSVKAGARYTIKLKYSPDAPGALGGFTAVVDEIITEYQDNISFSPDPVILPNGFDINEVQQSIGANHVYKISALAPIKKISLISAGEEFIVPLTSASTSAVKLNATALDGVVATKTDDNGCNYDLTITEPFFVNVPGGNSTVTIYVEDVDEGKKSCDVVYLNQGVMTIADDGSDYDLWFGNITIRAEVLDTTATDVKISYRQVGSEVWSETAATMTSTNVYEAVCTGFELEKEYEYRLIIGGEVKGKTISHVTPMGVQLPNAGFENWHQSGKAYFPFNADETAFWLTGNAGAASFGGNLTAPSEDIPAGSTGSYSAFLESKYVVVKFAAGNLFTGTFALSGTDGVVTFGRPFKFNGKPKSLSFWMKNNEGEIDQKSGSPASGTDKYTNMVIIANWDKGYAVDTSRADETTLTEERIKNMDGVIAYGWMSGQDSRANWTYETIDLTYIERNAHLQPNMVVVSFTPSGYGDYFCGSTKSWMYVDDVKLNY